MKISVTTAKSGKINICSDGEYLFTVPALIWYSSPLCGKEEAEEEELEELKAESERSGAYEKALRLLSFRAHTEKELRMKLGEKYGEEAVDGAVERLRGAGLIDDAAFARAYAEELYRRKSYSPERIKAELIKKGVDRQTSEAAARELETDPVSAIKRIAEKMRLPEELTRKDYARLMRRLVSAGYSISDIKKAINVSFDYE